MVCDQYRNSWQTFSQMSCTRDSKFGTLFSHDAEEEDFTKGRTNDSRVLIFIGQVLNVIYK